MTAGIVSYGVAVYQCVCVHVCVNQQTKNGSGDISCSIDHRISGCEYFRRVNCSTESGKSRLHNSTAIIAGIAAGVIPSHMASSLVQCGFVTTSSRLCTCYTSLGVVEFCVID